MFDWLLGKRLCPTNDELRRAAAERWLREQQAVLCHIGGGGIAGQNAMWASSHANQGLGSHPAANSIYPPATNQLGQHSYERTVFGVNPIEFKAQQAITTVVQQLPMRMATSIARINYAHTENNNGSPTNPHFQVTFTNAHTIKFYNVDTFPLEEDIARIALECP